MDIYQVFAEPSPHEVGRVRKVEYTNFSKATVLELERMGILEHQYSDELFNGQVIVHAYGKRA